MPKDQAHEQNNSILKGSGGIICILENPEALRRWMVAGPEVARCLTNFEDDFCSVIQNRNERGRHHEQDYSKQRSFQNNVRNLAKIIADFGNPFLEDCPKLIALDTRNCADESVVHTVRTIEEIGIRQYKKYVSSVIDNRTAVLHDALSRNSLTLFQRQHPKQVCKAVQTLTVVTSDHSLFSCLYIGRQQRDWDLNEFFILENQLYPPALSEFGNLRSTEKSDLIECLTKGITQNLPPESYAVKVFHRAAFVHALPVSSVSTFDEYAKAVFMPFVIGALSNTSKTDIVWDYYRPESLKDVTRRKRGKGVRKKVAGHVFTYIHTYFIATP